MVKRLLSCNSSDLLNFSASELKASIKASEGRTIVSENVVVHEPLVPDITNSEVAKAAGADLILLNQFDVLKPVILGLYENETTLKTAKVHSNAIKKLRKLTGRPVGVNLEPIAKDAVFLSDKEHISTGRIANRETFEAAKKLGLDFIVLTGNPGVGTTNDSISKNIDLAKKYFGGLVIAGKMHSAGVDEKIITLKDVQRFINNGADVILVPAVGTVPGFSKSDLEEIVDYAHKKNALVCAANGTSQEGSSVDVINRIAITNKICGVDLHHIGDSGYAGVAPVENIFALSKAIRGQRHTVSLIARSTFR